jgi:cell division protein FtsB
LSSPISLVAALIILVLLLRAAWNIHDKSRLSETRLDKAEIELAKLQDDHKELSEKSADLATDAGLENEMREKYRAVRPGESVAVIVDNAEPTGLSLSTTSSATTVNRGFWRSILALFGFM